MKKKYTIPIGVVLLAAITILFTSFLPVENIPEADWPELGNYEIWVKAEEEFCLQGRVYYDYLLGSDQHENEFSTWRLKLRDENNRFEHYFDFYIGDQNDNAGVPQGNYVISKNIDGFYKGFKGVFGVADIGKLGELPFFAEKGKITISQAEKETMAGHIQLILTNNMGETIEVAGKFFAPKDF